MVKRLVAGGLVVVAGLTACSAGPTTPAAPGPRAVYVTNWASDTIAEFTLADDGSLKAPAISLPVGKGDTHPQASIRSHDGKWLYVGNWGTRDVTPYRIEADGRLTAFPAEHGPAPEPVTPSGIALSPDGKNLYTANFSNGGDGTVSHYRVSADGRPHGVATVPAHGRGTTAVAVSPDGHTVLTANSASGDVSAFSVAADGSLTWVTTVATGKGAFFAAITPDSAHALVTNSLADSVSFLRLGTDSRPAVVSTVANPADEPRGIALTAQGDRAYIANFANGTGPGHITTFTVTATGLRPAGPAVATGGNGAEGIALSHDGKSLYNANFNTNGDGSVTSYPLAADGSVGTPRPPVLTGGRQPDLTSITLPVS
ncbi:beta-propeller fold lactonase family protein [Amycolatopsis rhabdoformis]|uniref:Beta-propeller fold lactonase family protein n=1 Tax=Amycolatopsis rhabdoformis TaxID=1448059 RepID=A0ABZ1HXC1_9PSEU|nr:beta-propeller fold lactonase family protein [Amycolatopsis rhabdoformis]WSE26256.1 beta-propeller fold lactonase family protein [Amycolatopsis rhabdoformis]